MLFAAALAATVLASDRTDPVAYFSAEAQVVLWKVQTPEEDMVVWNEVTFRVKRCLAGKCTAGEIVKMRVPASSWGAKAGDVLGIVRYAWQDDRGMPRAWSLSFSLDDEDQRFRFEHETEVALAGREQIESGTAVEMIKKAVPAKDDTVAQR